jgi:hypothetical protein
LELASCKQEIARLGREREGDRAIINELRRGDEERGEEKGRGIEEVVVSSCSFILPPVLKPSLYGRGPPMKERVKRGEADEQ